MGLASSTYTVLLSVNSPIFAPLYLAKVRGGAFRYIEFRYGFELPERRGADARAASAYDALAHRVLSKAPEDRRFIAGVADPFRSLIETDGSMYKAKIVAGLIRHQAFWLATENAELKGLRGAAAAENCTYIVTPPKYTSGYAVVADFLDLPKRPQTSDGSIDIYGEGRPRIYHNTEPGFERHLCRRLARNGCQKDRYAYLTTNPADHDGPLVQFANYSAAGSMNYKDTLMSALFCGNGWYTRHPMLFDDIRGDLIAAMRAISEDPVRAAVELKEYSAIAQDRFMDFSHGALPHDRLVQILEDLSIRDEIYCDELKIHWSQIVKGARLRPRFADPAPDLPEDHPARLLHRDPARFMDEYFADDAIAPDVVLVDSANHVVGAGYTGDAPAGEPERPLLKVSDRERTEAMPDYVRAVFQNYRDFVDKQFEAGPIERAGRDLEHGFERLAGGIGRSIFLLLGLGLGLWAAISATYGFGNAALSERLALASLIFIFPAHMMRYTRQIGESWLYDLGVLIAGSLSAGVLFLLTILRLFPHPSEGDKLGLLLFCISMVTVIFGAFAVATRDRIGVFWEHYVIRWQEQWIVLTRINRAQLAPPVGCGKAGQCTRCRIERIAS